MHGFFFWFFCALCTDELLKRNLLLNRYALDNRRETLGKKTNPKKKIGRGGQKGALVKSKLYFFIFFFAVIDTKIEEIAPTLNAATLDESTELRFTVPASADYFTR
jgi:hypothetical protein